MDLYKRLSFLQRKKEGVGCLTGHDYELKWKKCGVFEKSDQGNSVTFRPQLFFLNGNTC